MSHFPTFPAVPGGDHWPSLPYEEWKDTYATLHMWTQIVGKIKMSQNWWVNHSWHATLHLTSRGLTTTPIPYGHRIFELAFDFIDHKLLISTSEGQCRSVALAPRSVADFYGEVMEKLRSLDFNVQLNTVPNEVVDAIPFENDTVHASYDREQVGHFWRALLQADRVLKQFRSRFQGKCSPVHFFWGSFDLAVTRFSGRTAPEHPGGVPHLPDWVAKEAYSHEVSSCGFWPGNEQMPQAVFYAYAYPEPEGFANAPVRPAAASYHATLREFILPYEDVRRSASPDETLLDFLQSTYEAAAEHARWNRAELERKE